MEKVSVFRPLFPAYCNTGGAPWRYMIDSVQRSIIIKAAEKRPCVIIGRNADFILKERDDVLNVFITGDKKRKKKEYADYMKSQRVKRKNFFEMLIREEASNTNFIQNRPGE